MSSFGIRARVGGELVPGAPQVVKVDALQADSASAGSQMACGGDHVTGRLESGGRMAVIPRRAGMG